MQPYLCCSIQNIIIIIVSAKLWTVDQNFRALSQLKTIVAGFYFYFYIALEGKSVATLYENFCLLIAISLLLFPSVDFPLGIIKFPPEGNFPQAGKYCQCIPSLTAPQIICYISSYQHRQDYVGSLDERQWRERIESNGASEVLRVDGDPSWFPSSYQPEQVQEAFSKRPSSLCCSLFGCTCSSHLR